MDEKGASSLVPVNSISTASDLDPPLKSAAENPWNSLFCLFHGRLRCEGIAFVTSNRIGRIERNRLRYFMLVDLNKVLVFGARYVNVDIFRLYRKIQSTR